MAINTVTSRNSPYTIVITDQDQNQITVTQPITSTVEVGAVGPQGQKGDVGPQGPTGSSQPFSYLEGTTWNTTSSLQVTGSLAISGSFTPPIISLSERLSLSSLETGSLVYQSDGQNGFYVYF